METLKYRFEQGRRSLAGMPQLVGVVGSGNLEVLIEPSPLQGACEIEVRTAAVGFGATWQAVMADFHDRWSLADARISINDMGATPAVVSLRLDQAVESLTGAFSKDSP
ncbi:malonate decarboxylase acyl carrier protein [Massilia sp. CFBP9012]|uniref:Malonate decarboxylase acyl carrier protein n=1 Tax=Massilia arenae TaxID=2603288 RepID=A0A5C7G2E8_9BURK|nr:MULTISPECIES: malonate decarboxylase acyl carrier protein [Massilia]MDY0976945.1 malonate decarboxylase acyl carrier protein [Massilia sp. CFBP9012]TXF97418.1 malonate decarboxylase acyl carrier protein [Massilia arenae]